MSNAPSKLSSHAAKVLILVLPLILEINHAALALDARVTGFGTRKCIEWQEWKTAQNGEARAMAIEWANGFIAGHNIYARAGNGQVNSVVADAKILATLLDSYCQKNPENRILAGVIDINQSLGGAKITVAPKTPAARTDRANEANKPSEI